MRKTIFFSLMVLLASCASTTKDSRKIASVETESSDAVESAPSQGRNISGTFLAVAKYKTGRSGPNKAAARIYFHEIEGEKGNYHAVLLEYVNLLKMAPSYIASNKLQFISDKVGYLKNITSNISAYKVVPGKTENTFEMWPLMVSGDQIVANKDAQPRILTLSPDENLHDALAGATISKVKADEPEEIFFPKEDDEKSNGLQYGIAKLTYAKAKLESTWRKNYLPGPYLSQYGRVKDVVLELNGTGDSLAARFKINEEMSKMEEGKRAKMFTNEKSAFLKGDFNVSEPLDGMFLFTASEGTEAKTESIVKGKIGLFIDIFDASKSLNQDVVELALIDTDKPEDFLMYYEHPGNGEGSSEAEEKN